MPVYMSSEVEICFQDCEFENSSLPHMLNPSPTFFLDHYETQFSHLLNEDSPYLHSNRERGNDPRKEVKQYVWMGLTTMERK